MSSYIPSQSHVNGGNGGSRRADETNSDRERSHQSKSHHHSSSSARDPEYSIARQSSSRHPQPHDSEAIRRESSRDKTDRDSHHSTKESSHRHTQKPEGRETARDDYRSLVSNARTGGRNTHRDETVRPDSGMHHISRHESKAVVPQESRRSESTHKDSRAPTRSQSVKESTRREESTHRAPHRDSRAVVPEESGRTESSHRSSRVPSRSHSMRESARTEGRGSQSNREPYDSVRTVTQSNMPVESVMRNQSVRPSEGAHRSRSSTHGSHAHPSHAPSSHARSSHAHPSHAPPSHARSSHAHSSQHSHLQDYDSLSRSMNNMALAPRDRSYHSQHSARESTLPPLPESRPIDSASQYGSYGGPSQYGASQYGPSGFDAPPYGSSARYLEGPGGNSCGPGCSCGASGASGAGPQEEPYRTKNLPEFIMLVRENRRRRESGVDPACVGPDPLPPLPFEMVDFERAWDFINPGDTREQRNVAVRRAFAERTGWYPENGSLHDLGIAGDGLGGE